MIPRQVAVEYKVDRAGPDVEREQLNRILEEIKRQIANLGGDVNYVTQQQLQDALDTIVFPPSGGGIVETIVEGFAISVDATDPANPVVSVVPADLISADAGNQLVLGVDSLLYVPPGGASTPKGVTAIVGVSGGPQLQVGDIQEVVYSPGDYGPFLSWEITLSPSGTVEVDVLKNGVSMCTGGSRPEITTGTSASGDTTGWLSNTVDMMDRLTFEITIVTGLVDRVDVLLSPEPP